MPTRTRNSPGAPSTAGVGPRVRSCVEPIRGRILTGELNFLHPAVHTPADLLDDRFDRIQATRPRATRVMQYVHRPTILVQSVRSHRAIRRIAIRCRRTIAARRPGVEELHDLGPFPGGREFALGTVSRTRCRWAAAMQPATMRGFSYAPTRSCGGSSSARRFDDGARDEDMGVRVLLRGHDGVPLAGQRLLHEAPFPVILRATMRLDEDFHGSAMDAGISCYEPVGATLMSECAFETIMEPGPEHPLPRQRLHHRDATYSPGRPDGTGARAQRRAKAASSDTDREGATEGKPSRGAHPPLAGEGDQMERRADDLDGVTSAPGRRTAQRVSFVREGVGRSRFGATA